MNIFKRSKVCAIGIIGGADGPTAVFTSSKQKSEEDIIQTEFLDFAATQVVANFRPFEEVNELLLTKYKAIPYTLRKNEMRSLKANVIVNYYREVLDLPAPLPQKPTRKQLLEYAESDTTFEQARNYPAEKLGLVMKAYEIPSETDKKCIVEFETTTSYMTTHNISREIIDELFLWQGISQDDIDNRTPRFVAYVYTLHNLGKLHPAK